VTDAGYGLAAISYDPVETLKGFADKHGITFPLLSDQGSKVIDAWGLRNREATGRTAGIPHPGTFMIDRSGTIVSRSFEQPYQERRSATSLLAELTGAVPGQTTTIRGGQATFELSTSDAVAAVGHRVTLNVKVTPGPKMHVYAPGQKGYIPIALTLTEDAAFKAHPLKFPASTTYVYEPLNETVQVYSSPFTLTQEVTISLARDIRARAEAGEVLTIAGELEYQACDDKVCYRPETIPVEWKVKLSPIVR
jgi:DsbC/DsbD-like thiol-disulfide interchange protein